MRQLFLSLVTMAMFGVFAIPTFAQGTLIIDDGQESILTGVVKSYRFDDIVIDVNGKNIYVDIDALDIKNSVEDYFPVGTSVRVIGELEDDDEFNANKVMKVEPTDNTEIIVTD